ncbi:MAG TPA: helix-turn-helix domain-containing protein [Spirochaetota bacterium]|nr:helix-turn-helix domain-containing protein [Spirochaetota bacterium]
MVVNIVNKLQDLGFSANESRVYAALLEENPVTAYELGKRSGVPSSKIYEVLCRLLEKEMVFELVEANRKRYIPEDPDRFINKYSGRVKQNLDELKSGFDQLELKPNVSYIISCNCRDELMQRAESLITSAGSSLLISGWAEELNQFQNHFVELAKKGVRTAIVHYGKSVLSGVQCFEHPVEDILYREKGGRGFVIVADSKEAISATVFEDGSVEAAWSSNSGFVSMADDYIRHDIYILKVVRHFGREMKDMFGDNYRLLRNIFADEVIK